MLSRILALAEKHGFIKKILLPTLHLEQYKLGPTGLLLQENLKLEWFHNTVVNKDISVFLNKGDICKTYDFVKELCLEKLPFGIAEVIKNENTSVDESIGEQMEDKHINFKTYFPTEDFILKCSVFVSSSTSTLFFHQWQRQRRIWWRKFSASPGRYFLTDVKSDDNNVQHCEILAKYPWGTQPVESLVFKLTDENYTVQQLQFKEGKKTVQSHILISEINLSTMFLNSLCDAFEEPLLQGKPRELFRFHRKVAPYKISFAVTGTNAAVISELSDLSLYLCKQLRANHVSTLLLPSSSKHSLDAQYKQYDQLGIPYNVVLNENTLKNGIVQLRSRDTTLKEQVHVTDLVNYVEQLFKNY